MNKPLSMGDLIAINKLMQSMLFEAESGNWDALSRLDSRRRELISQSDRTDNLESSQSTQNPVADHYDKSIYESECNEILQLDVRISETVKRAKLRLVEENRSMRNQVVAKKGYAQTATINTSF